MTEPKLRMLNPWRQGSLVNGSFVDKGALTGSTDSQELYVVATHDCDLQAGSAIEAKVELLPARWQAKADGTCTQGKNPRVLHLTDEREDQTLVIEQQGKLLVDKDHLLGREPTGQLIKPNCRLLARWLGSRYSRAALPDSLEQRLKKARTVDGSRLDNKQIATSKKERSLIRELMKLFATDGISIEGIYVGLGGEETSELEADRSYGMSIAVVADAPDGADEDIRMELANSLAAKIRTLVDLAIWDTGYGEVELEKCIGVTEHDFALYYHRRMLRWHLDSLSADEVLEDD